MTSWGIVRKKPVRMTVANETVATTSVSASPGRLLIRPRARNIENSGTMSTSVGMISGARTTTKSRARPGGRNRVSEYAAGIDTTRTTATAIAVT